MKRISIIFLVLLAFGCNKKEFKIYLGDYDCSKFVEIQEPGATTDYTLYPTELVIVSRSDDFIEIAGVKIDIKDMEPEQTHIWEKDGINYSLLFQNDSMFYSIKEQEENKVSIINYWGKKREE